MTYMFQIQNWPYMTLKLALQGCKSLPLPAETLVNMRSVMKRLSSEYHPPSSALRLQSSVHVEGKIVR